VLAELVGPVLGNRRDDLVERRALAKYLFHRVVSLGEPMCERAVIAYVLQQVAALDGCSICERSRDGLMRKTDAHLALQMPHNEVRFGVAGVHKQRFNKLLLLLL